MSDQDRDAHRARQGRIAALVIATSGMAAILAPWIIVQAGLPLRYEFLIYFAALAGFVWAGVVTYQIWKTRDD